MERPPHGSPERSPDRKVAESRGGWTWCQKLPACGGMRRDRRQMRATEGPDIRDIAFATGKGRRPVWS